MIRHLKVVITDINSFGFDTSAGWTCVTAQREAGCVFVCCVSGSCFLKVHSLISMLLLMQLEGECSLSITANFTAVKRALIRSLSQFCIVPCDWARKPGNGVYIKMSSREPSGNILIKCQCLYVDA